MIEIRENPIWIQEFDGARTRFDATSLQTKLIGAFLAAGRSESTFFAEDIALAVEYSLLRAPRPDPVFGRGELDAAVIRTLEETGFPDVGRLFRRSGAESIIEIAAKPEPLAELLGRHLACPDEHFAKIIGKVSAAAAQLKIASAPPQLFLELARYYSRCEQLAAPAVPSTAPAVTLTREEIESLLPPEGRNLCASGILRVAGITTLFARIHFFFMMTRFADVLKLQPPVTELELEPLLYKAGTLLEQCRKAIDAKVAADKPLPFIFAVPDMFDFIANSAGGDRGHSDALATELAGTLTAEFGVKLYKLSLS